MRHAMNILAIMLICSGCQPTRPSMKESPQDQGQPGQAEALETGSPIDKVPGDAEAKINVELLVEAGAGTGNIKMNAVQSARGGGHVAMATVDIAPPYPKSLAGVIRINMDDAFTGQPVVLRGVLRREQKPLETIQTVVLDRTPLEVAGAVWPMEFKFDLLKGLETPPATLLFDVILGAEVTPPGTDPAKLDPGKPASADVLEGSLISNPLRINFVQAGAGA